jgi:hypothetical protein
MEIRRVYSMELPLKIVHYSNPISSEEEQIAQERKLIRESAKVPSSFNL